MILNHQDKDINLVYLLLINMRLNVDSFELCYFKLFINK